ncbi:MAG: COR domain-containing protein, partial [Cyanobacteria bacterium P01_H01_bin.15]
MLSPSIVSSIIKALPGLQTLYLTGNQLSSVPAELGNLSSLQELYLTGNPNLVFPPPDILEQDTASIVAYLKQQLDEQVVQWISKLVIVGEGGVGKTHLLKSLQRKDYDPGTTHGIEISQLYLQHPSKAEFLMQLNAWDFGGQQIYHATHQFFLTKRSLFILVWNARTEYEQGKLDYWLKAIRANAPDSPIVLVATHIDQRDANFPLYEFQKEFPQIVGSYSVSNTESSGIDNLRSELAKFAAELPLMGATVPKAYVDATEDIRALKEKFTTPKKLRDVMLAQKVRPDNLSVLSRQLHDLGEILYYPEDQQLKDFIILQPQWVTEYISKVLEAEDVIGRDGIFSRDCMDQLWEDLTPGIREYFLRLMEKFDLSYLIPDSKDKSLVVERLPLERPDYEATWDAAKQQPNCPEITMKFELSEILPGIPTWFIARQHRFTMNIHWRTGVLFQDTEKRHLALTQIRKDSLTNVNYLQLSVRGPAPYSFFNLLRDGIEVTFARYPGLNIKRTLPCPDPLQEDCLNEFTFANLAKRLERIPPRKTIECPNCLEDISVPQLLFGLHSSTERDVLDRLDELEANLSEQMGTGFRELRTLFQRNFLQTFKDEQRFKNTACPNVFALRPDGRNWLFKDLDKQRIHLQLYCQYPGEWHPTECGGCYEIDNPRQWLQKIGPGLNGLFKALKYATPLVSPYLGVAVSDVQDYIKDDVKLMGELVKKLPELQTGRGFT